MKKILTTFVMCSVAAVGCDGLATEKTEGPAIATMHGTLLLADGANPPQGDVHLSILWANTDSEFSQEGCGSDGITYHDETALLEQRLELDTDFPASFSVNVTQPPPDSALYEDPHTNPGAPPVKLAVGQLIVYRDVNGNGHLDHSTLDETSPDEVLAAGEGNSPAGGEDGAVHYHIVYASKAAPEGASYIYGARAAGYSLIRQSWAQPTEEVSPLDEGAEITLTLEPTAFVQRWACDETCQTSNSDSCPDDLADLPDVQGEGEAVPNETASWVLERVEGDSTIQIAASCKRGYSGEDTSVRHEVYSVDTITWTGCTTKYVSCAYKRAELAEGQALPCTEYEEVSFPNDF